ncbi:Hypothetical predicted protein [Octopus vulgaris]|uniref:Uncharacterized protein n=1 Tax=Octopus vulgaris TaxID=6645 RepID=A0AA36EVW6_OCTVU|nr:Hypothetical predicted protein [Octopus vulgaris]
MSTRSASESGTSSDAEKCLGELGIGIVVGVGVGGDMAESADGDGAAAFVSDVLMAVVGVEREGARLSFSFSLEQSVLKCLNEMQHFVFLPSTLTGIMLPPRRSIWCGMRFTLFCVV